MRNSKKLISVLLCAAITVAAITTNVSATTQSISELPTDAFLAYTGMTSERIASLDSDIKDYIVHDLKENAQVNDLEYIDTNEILTPTTRATQPLTGISFSASAWKSGSTIYIYPTYEYTTPKKQAGSDSFAFQLGDAMRPYEFGGQTWTKLNAGDNWSKYKTMIANNQNLSGAEFSGTPLGSSPFEIYVKGATYCHADVGSGTDKRIAMSYMNNPNNSNYSISFSVSVSGVSLGVSYSSGGTIYTASKIVTLSY